MRMYDVGLEEENEELNPTRDSTEEETGEDIGKEEALKYEELLRKIDSLLGMHCIPFFFFPFTMVFCRSSNVL